jgi:MFS family permease
MHSARRAWWFVGLLCFASLLSVIDRGIINLVVDPIRHELALSDVQISLLQGLAFVFIYSFGGVALGVVADRYNRRNLIVFGILLWSLATLATGFVRNFTEMFAARIVVGLGEAALAPAAVSLIAELFAADRRGRPMGLYMTGQAIANGVAITLTGLVIAAAAAHQFDALLAGLALPANMSSWRVTFLLCGASGVVVALALLTCREAPRGSVSTAPNLLAQGGETLRHLVRRWRFFLPLYLGFASCFTAAYGAAAWTPSMLGRAFGLGPAQLAQILGSMTVIFAAAGPLLGSVIIDPLVRRFGDSGRLVLVAAVTLLAIPAGLAVLAPDKVTAALLVASSSAVYPFVGLCVITTLQSQWPAPMRGLGVALTGLLNGVIGAACGPLLIAFLTERVFMDPAKVGRSIALVIVPALVLASVLFMLAAKAVVDPVSESDQLGRI